jgi:hypothetical protein
VEGVSLLPLFEGWNCCFTVIACSYCFLDIIFHDFLL